MTKTKIRIGRRALALTLAVLTIITLVFSLSACGETKEKFRERSAHEDIETYVGALISQNESYKLRFIAASRGYDISPKENETVLQDIEEGAEPDWPAAIAEGKEILALLLEETNFKVEQDHDDVTLFAETLDESAMAKVVASKSIKTEFSLETDAGFPGILLIWIGKFLGILTSLFGNSYLLALLVFALIVEILMLPVSIKQQKNMIGLAKLRPAMAKIEKKYAGRSDPQTMQKKREELMDLQQKEGYSPFSGCLPMLLQLIIVGFILYPIITNPVYYMLNQSEEFSSALLYYATSPVGAGGLGYALGSKGNVIELLSVFNSENIAGIANFAPIANGSEILARYNELSVPDFTIFGGFINLGEIPSFASILVLVPILNIGAQWLTMFLTKKWNPNGTNPAAAADGQTAASMKIMEFLPLALTFFILFQLPAMIGVYWLIRSFISLGKQYIIKKAMPIPQYTEEEIKEMEKAEKERQKAQKAALKAQPKVRSLHYIDDDDYEELPELKAQESAKHVSDDAPEIKD